MRVERRDHQKRADTLRRVVEWLTRGTVARHVPPDIAGPDVARRILTRLAVRGLVQRTDSGWVARQVLAAPAEVQQISPELDQRVREERRDAPALECHHCRKSGFVRQENIVRGSVAERHFFCGICGHHWKVKDRRSKWSAPPPRDRAHDRSRMWT